MSTDCFIGQWMSDIDYSENIYADFFQYLVDQSDVIQIDIEIAKLDRRFFIWFKNFDERVAFIRIQSWWNGKTKCPTVHKENAYRSSEMDAGKP